MPGSKTLDSYSNVLVKTPDGILFDRVHVQQNNFEAKNGMDLPETDWKRHGSLAWDYMAVKEK